MGKGFLKTWFGLPLVTKELRDDMTETGRLGVIFYAWFLFSGFPTIGNGGFFLYASFVQLYVFHGLVWFGTVSLFVFLVLDLCGIFFFIRIG